MKLFKILVVVLAVSCLLAACSNGDKSTAPGLTTIATTEATTAPTEESPAPTEATTVPTEESSVPTEATTVPTEATTQPTETVTAPPIQSVPTTPPQNGVIPSTQIISEGDGYRIIREDRSYRSSSGQILNEHYYDYIELTSGTPAAQKINARLKQPLESFFMSERDLREPVDAFGAYGLLYTKSSSITYMSDKCLCVNISMEWYQGGVHNGGNEGYVFDLETGDPATLPGLTGMDPATLEAQLKQIAWAQIEPLGPWEGSYEKLSSYTLDTFNYSIVGGQIVLYFAEYEFFSGAAGPVTVNTGIYV